MIFLNVWKKLVQTTQMSGRPRTVRTVVNISTFNDLVLSQADALQTHRTAQQIARETGIHRSSVVRIIRNELRQETPCTGAD